VFVALGIQRANACAISPSLAFPSVQKLSTFSHKPRVFRIKLLNKNMGFDLKLSTLSHKPHVFRIKLLNKNMYFDFCTTFV
jgi:hypothetical protein